jgi:hypothetical protein
VVKVDEKVEGVEKIQEEAVSVQVVLSIPEQWGQKPDIPVERIREKVREEEVHIISNLLSPRSLINNKTPIWNHNNNKTLIRVSERLLTILYRSKIGVRRRIPVLHFFS